MKTLANILLVTSLTFSLFITDIFGQNYREVVPLDKGDYACFLQFECVVNSQSLVNKGWNFVFDSSVNGTNKERVVEMKGQNIRLVAFYDETGSLVRSTYELENTALPQIVAKHILGGSHEGWNITGTRKSILDFNQSRTTWFITLQNGETSETLAFTQRDIAALEHAAILMADQKDIQ